jgi:UPF0755 protein
VKRAFLGMLLLLIVGAAAGAAWMYSSLKQPYKGYSESETFVEIAPGSSPARMARQLVDAGVVRNTTTFRAAVWMRGAGRRLQAGEYRFDSPLTPGQVVDRIVRGDVYIQPITFREGLTIRQMAELFEEKRLGAGQEFIKAARNVSLIRDLAITGGLPRLRSFAAPERAVGGLT